MAGRSSINKAILLSTKVTNECFDEGKERLCRRSRGCEGSRKWPIKDFIVLQFHASVIAASHLFKFVQILHWPDLISHEWSVTWLSWKMVQYMMHLEMRVSFGKVRSCFTFCILWEVSLCPAVVTLSTWEKKNLRVRLTNSLKSVLRFLPSSRRRLAILFLILRDVQIIRPLIMARRYSVITRRWTSPTRTCDDDVNKTELDELVNKQMK